VGPRTHVLDGGAGPPREGAIFGVICPIEKHCKFVAMYAKTAELVKILYEGLTCGTKEAHVR